MPRRVFVSWALFSSTNVHVCRDESCWKLPLCFKYWTELLPKYLGICICVSHFSLGTWLPQVIQPQWLFSFPLFFSSLLRAWGWQQLLPIGLLPRVLCGSMTGDCIGLFRAHFIAGHSPSWPHLEDFEFTPWHVSVAEPITRKNSVQSYCRGILMHIIYACVFKHGLLLYMHGTLHM